MYLGVSLLRGSAPLALLAAAIACGPTEAPPELAPAAPAQESRPATPLTYVGVATCEECHAEVTKRWRGSHHDRALEIASEASVLGDFDDAVHTHFGVTTRFSRRDASYIVRTEGPDGTMADFEVAYTFGVEPLQQLLIRLPEVEGGAGGRLQALGIAWDSRPHEAGGQRWFSLHPDERIAPDDVLHWTGPAGRWNTQCADCHSTGIERGYDVDANRYDTRWVEIDVGCEACHGPGSRHAEWARAGADAAQARGGLRVDLANRATWTFADGAAIAHREPARTEHSELDTCAPCHSRRSVLAPSMPGEPFLDANRPALLEDGLYYADGQIDDEVYVWGSFVQSRMFAAGVTCSDCHEPHALRIDVPDEACGRCHRPEVFATPEHHHHRPDSAGSSCVACHVPERTYMMIDPRRDHSFRVPRPELANRTGSPNACEGCHTDAAPGSMSAPWQRWWGDEGARGRHFGDVLHAGRQGLAGAHDALRALATDAEAPAIARASALSLLRQRPGPGIAQAVQRGASDREPLVRMAAAELAALLPAAQRLAILPLLSDPIRAVRIAAAPVLAPVPPHLWPAGGRAALGTPLAEYRRAQLAAADQPESHTNLAALHGSLGETEAALRAYETALRVGPWFVPAYVNYADLLRQLGRDEEGEPLLRRALELAPESAGTHHSLGLLLVRQGRRDEALVALARAAELEPRDPRFAYVYAVALHSAGQVDAARNTLLAAAKRHPNDPTIRSFLAELSQPPGAQTR